MASGVKGHDGRPDRSGPSDHRQNRYPSPVVVRIRVLRVLPLLLLMAGMGVIIGLALWPQFARPSLPLVGSTAFVCACTTVFLVLAIRRPTIVQLTMQGIQVKKSFASWEQVVEVTAFRASTGRTGLPMVVVTLASPPATTRNRPAQGHLLWISCQMAINRHRLAELITDYHNAWAAEHGKPLLPPPGKGISW